MNRRSFISTITALAGIVLAKIKAPATLDPLHTVTHPYWPAGDVSKKAAFFNELGLPLNERILIGIGKPLSGKSIRLDDAIYTRGKDGLYRRTDTHP